LVGVGVAGPGVPCQNLLTVGVLCWLSFFLFDFRARCIVDSLWVICPCILGWCSGMFPVGGLCVLGTWVVGCPGWLHRAWEAMFCVKSFIVIFPVFYMCRSLWCSSYSCGSISSYICFLGAFVPVVFTTPRPSFHRGKIAPGGGRGSRSPQSSALLLSLCRIPHSEKMIPVAHLGRGALC